MPEKTDEDFDREYQEEHIRLQLEVLGITPNPNPDPATKAVAREALRDRPRIRLG
jgi:hypothetical protein